MKGGDVSSATAKFLKVSPRKVARLARECIGRDVAVLSSILSFYPQKAAGMLRGVIMSASANLLQKDEIGRKNNDVFVRSVFVDKGPSTKRLIYRARGKADRKESKTTHIRVEVVYGGKKKND